MKNEMAKLVYQLKNRVVRFEFRKKDGSIREAVGTRKVDLMPPTEQRERTGPEKKGVVCFFDFTVDGWRSFCDTTEVRVIG